MDVIETGTGSPPGSIPHSGMGMGGTLAPTVLTGTGMGKICSRGDGDEKSFPDGEFPVAMQSSACMQDGEKNRAERRAHCVRKRTCW
jgi:hypothetical protein